MEEAVRTRVSISKAAAVAVTSSSSYGSNREIAVGENIDNSKVSSVGSVFGICRSVQNFQKIGRIGEGTYGYVYKALDKEKNNTPVALKRIILHNEEHDGFPLTSIREIRTLMRCSECTYIVHLLDVVVGKSRDAVFLAFEYCEHDLSTILKRIPHPFKEAEIKTLVLQLLSAVKYVHSKWIVHRDIKLSNLLYTKHGQLKLADFGLARQLSVPPPADLTPVVMTLWYRAPEVLLEMGHYSFAVDCWSVGCILAELLLTQPLFEGNSELETINCIFKLLGAPSERIWPEIRNASLIKNGIIDLSVEQTQYRYNLLSDRFPATLSQEGLGLLQALLTYRPQIRISARDAYLHEYFQQSPYPTAEDFMPTFPSFHDDDVAQKQQEQLRRKRTSMEFGGDIYRSSSCNSSSNYDRSSAQQRNQGQYAQYTTYNATISQQQRRGEKRPYDRP